MYVIKHGPIGAGARHGAIIEMTEEAGEAAIARGFATRVVDARSTPAAPPAPPTAAPDEAKSEKPKVKKDED